jgi:hypothetical protein
VQDQSQLPLYNARTSGNGVRRRNFAALVSDASRMNVVPVVKLALLVAETPSAAVITACSVGNAAIDVEPERSELETPCKSSTIPGTAETRHIDTGISPADLMEDATVWSTKIFHLRFFQSWERMTLPIHISLRNT